MTNLETLQNMIDNSNNIVFFGGAGVSTESGLPDFRGTNGLYNHECKYNPEEMLSLSFFIAHPDEFYKFYKNKLLALNAKPNAAHFKLAELEKAGKLKAIITQNIDGLHQAAGSKNIYELHGSMHSYHCTKCGKEFDMNYILNSNADMNPVPYCDECHGLVKPDIVLYQENLDFEVLANARREIAKADMLIVAGTSLSVYPAAGLLDAFFGKYLVVINKDMPKKDLHVKLYIDKPVGEVLDKITV